MRNGLWNKVYLSDVVDGLKKIEDKSVDCVLIDPPYNIGYDFGNNECRKEMKEYVHNKILSVKYQITEMENNQNDIDPTIIAQKVCSEIYDGVTTRELDILASEVAISLYSTHPDYSVLASRIVVSNHHKNTHNSFSEKLDEMIKTIELTLQKNMSVEELEKFKKYPHLNTTKSEIVERLIDELDYSPTLKQKIINELSEE